MVSSVDEPANTACVAVQAELLSWVVGAAAPSAALLAHVSMCPGCQADLVSYQLAWRGAGGPPGQVRARLLARVAAEPVLGPHPVARC